MGLVLKYVQHLPAGGFRYRRRVPLKLLAAVGKGEIVHHLGDTEKEALRRYPSIHAAAERLLANAARSGGVPTRIDADGDSDLAAYRRLVARLRQAGFDPGEEPASIGENFVRQQHADSLLDSYPIDPSSGEPLVPSPDAVFIRALNSGLPEVPAPTLTDAKGLYLTEKVGDGERPENRATRLRFERVLANAKKALGGDRKLTAIRRADAKEVRDHFLRQYSVPTAKRYFTDLRAMVALAIKETELDRRGVINPFSGVPIEEQGSRKDDRLSFTDDQVEAIAARLAEHGGEDLRDLWTVLTFTGCRIAEVTGLLRSDVMLDGVATPHLAIRFRDNRRLKNKSADRDIPLLPSAVAAVGRAAKRAGASPYLFPAYAEGRGANSASAALMKHVRSVSKDKRLTNHSLRHRLKDKLILAGIPEDVQERIIGHGADEMSKRYGGREAALVVMAGALKKALGAA